MNLWVTVANGASARRERQARADEVQKNFIAVDTQGRRIFLLLRMKHLISFVIGALTAAALRGQSVLWDESVNGSLDAYREYPTNGYVIQFVGEAAAETNIIRGTSRTIKTGNNALGEDDAFYFIVPVGRRITAMTIETRYDPVWLQRFGYPTAAGLLCANSTGLWENRDSVYGGNGYWWFRDEGTHDLLTPYGIGSLSAGPYSMQVSGWGDIYYLHDGEIAYMYYTLTIKTEPVPVPFQTSIKPLGNNNLLVSWPTNATGFTLQTTTNLHSPVVWTDLTNSPAVVGVEFVMTNSIAGAARFYRLIKP